MAPADHRFALDPVARLLAIAKGDCWPALSLEEQDVYRDQAAAVDDFYRELYEGYGGLPLPDGDEERVAA